MKLKNYLLFLTIFTNIFFISSINSSQSILFTFVSPVPNSKLNNPGTNLILKINKGINVSNFTLKSITVTGSISGKHKCEFNKTDDDHTMIFKPYTKFALGETVTVEVISNNSAEKIKNKVFNFKFNIKYKQAQINPSDFYRNEFGNGFLNSIIKGNRNPNFRNSINDTIPDDFPQISVTNNNNPTEGKIFLCNFQTDTSAHYGPYLMILNKYGNLIWYKHMQNSMF